MLILTRLRLPDARNEEKDPRGRGHNRLLQNSNTLVSLCRVWGLRVCIYTSDKLLHRLGDNRFPWGHSRLSNQPPPHPTPLIPSSAPKGPRQELSLVDSTGGGREGGGGGGGAERECAHFDPRGSNETKPVARCVAPKRFRLKSKHTLTTSIWRRGKYSRIFDISGVVSSEFDFSD
uniref:Uncharacterized protein n=1 Tax=Mesocestoides corti TaxID=53468 RepID=A0A5K3FHC3_MESCO